MSDLNVNINKYKLPEECEQQPGMYLQYAERHALAKAKYDRAKNNLKLVEAETLLNVKQATTDMKPKPTVDDIKAMRDCSPVVVQARKEEGEAAEEVYVLQAIVSALSDRRDQLNNLVKLQVAGFFGIETHGDASAKKVSSDIRKNLNNKEASNG